MSEKKIKFETQEYLTLAYLTTVAVGMMFDHKYYSNFNINIFEYADILDFLLAPAKNVELIFFALGTLLVVWLFFVVDRLWQRKWPISHQKMNFGMSKEAMEKYRPFIFVFSLVVYLGLASDFYGERTYDRFQKNSEQIGIVFESDQRVINGKMIGKNSDYIFLETTDKKVKVIPIATDVQEIIIPKPGKKKD